MTCSISAFPAHHCKHGSKAVTGLPQSITLLTPPLRPISAVSADDRSRKSVRIVPDPIKKTIDVLRFSSLSMIVHLITEQKSSAV
jgi:hypothetical protein